LAFGHAAGAGGVAPGHRDLNNEVEEDEAHQQRGVDGGERVPARAGGVGSHEAEQVRHHGRLQRPNGDPLSLGVVDDDLGVGVLVLVVVEVGEGEGDDDDHERRGERGGVAVEEGHVPLAVGVPDDGVAGEVPVGRVLPDVPRRAEPGGVRHRGHQRGQQQDVLAELQRDFGRSSIIILALVGSLVIGGSKLGLRILHLQLMATSTRTLWCVKLYLIIRYIKGALHGVQWVRMAA